MTSDVQHLLSEAEHLVAVLGRSDGTNGFAALAFVFDAGTLHCRCNYDTDEIIFEVVERDSVGYPNVDDAALAPLVGMNLEYAWEMTNHRGYSDAFQLRFIDAARREEVRQFEVLASVIHVARVSLIDSANPA